MRGWCWRLIEGSCTRTLDVEEYDIYLVNTVIGREGKWQVSRDEAGRAKKIFSIKQSIPYLRTASSTFDIDLSCLCGSLFSLFQVLGEKSK